MDLGRIMAFWRLGPFYLQMGILRLRYRRLLPSCHQPSRNWQRHRQARGYSQPLLGAEWLAGSSLAVVYHRMGR